MVSHLACSKMFPETAGSGAAAPLTRPARGIPSVATATEGWPFGNLRALPSASLPSTLLRDAEQSRGVRDGEQRRTVSEVRSEV